MSTSQMVALFNAINTINNNSNNFSSITIGPPISYLIIILFILLIICFIGALIFLIKETFFKGNFIMCKDCVHVVKVGKRFICSQDWSCVNKYFVCDEYQPKEKEEEFIND